jgi:hypothetical protein
VIPAPTDVAVANERRMRASAIDAAHKAVSAPAGGPLADVRRMPTSARDATRDAVATSGGAHARKDAAGSPAALKNDASSAASESSQHAVVTPGTADRGQAARPSAVASKRIVTVAPPAQQAGSLQRPRARVSQPVSVPTLRVSIGRIRFADAPAAPATRVFRRPPAQFGLAAYLRSRGGPG